MSEATSWDDGGRMISATVFTLTTYFTYTGDGGRVAVGVEGYGTTEYIPDYARGGRVLVEKTVTTSTLYLYGHECLAERRDGDWAYYLYDGTRYVRQVADEEGEIESAWRYDPDGLVREGPQGPVSHLVCGGIYDWSTGLLYKGGRYFDPTLGIWLALMPLAVIQWWRRRKKGRSRPGVPWLVGVLVVGVGVGGILVGCGPRPCQGPDCPTPTPICTETPSPSPTPNPTPIPSPTPTPPLLGGYMIFVDSGGHLGDPQAYKWPEDKVLVVRQVWERAVNSGYASDRGLGSVDQWAAQFGIAKSNPIQLAYTSRPDTSNTHRAGWYNGIPGVHFGDQLNPVTEDWRAYHELAHIWDRDDRFSSPMAKEMGATYAGYDYSGVAYTDPSHGTFPTKYAETTRAEDFADSVLSYFMPDKVMYTQWSDDDPRYRDPNTGNPVQPDSILCPPKTTDRYDYVEWLFGHGPSP